MKQIKQCIVDTNVPVTANLAETPANVPLDMVDCVIACVQAVKHVTEMESLVIDDGDEIFTEYRKNLSLSGKPGMGDIFMKWVHDNRYRLPACQRVAITKRNNTYTKFPSHPGLAKFDPSDKKFVAVANAHANKPPILQATDSKWLGWEPALKAVEITVIFLCPVYIEKKHAKKSK